MTDGGGHGSGICSAPGALEHYLAGREAEIEQRVTSRVLAEVRRMLDRGAGIGPEWLTQGAAGRLAGVRAQTIRAWIKAGVLTKGRRGRINAQQLRAYLAANAGDTSVAAAVDLSTERARRAAREILDGKRGGRNQ